MLCQEANVRTLASLCYDGAPCGETLLPDIRIEHNCPKNATYITLSGEHGLIINGAVS